MTRTLILIRHCKSDWDSRADDHARPLNARGARSAPRIGAFLAQNALVPGLVLCSDALRTRQTWTGIAGRLPGAPNASLIPGLYLAEPEVMLTALQTTSEPIVAMIGHNPGTAALARALAKIPPTDDRFPSYPTGATTVLHFAGEIAPGMGEIRHFIVPRDLPDPN